MPRAFMGGWGFFLNLTHKPKSLYCPEGCARSLELKIVCVGFFWYNMVFSADAGLPPLHV